MINLQTPPMLSGTEAQQLIALRSYLFQMSRELNQALNNLDETNFTEGGAARTVVAGGLGKGAAAEVGSQASALKSLIIKNANIVKSEIDRIETELESNYVAVSDFGAYTENIQTELEATAANVTQNINAISQIESEYGSYVTSVSGRIVYGIVGYEDDGTPILGVAVGSDLTVTPSESGSEAMVTTSNFASVFTDKKLAFMQGGIEIAYLSNQKLYITEANIVRGLSISDKWNIGTSKGFTIKWIG